MYPSGPPGVHRTVSRSAGLELVSLASSSINIGDFLQVANLISRSCFELYCSNFGQNLAGFQRSSSILLENHEGRQTDIIASTIFKMSSQGGRRGSPSQVENSQPWRMQTPSPQTPREPEVVVLSGASSPGVPSPAVSFELPSRVRHHGPSPGWGGAKASPRANGRVRALSLQPSPRRSPRLVRCVVEDEADSDDDGCAWGGRWGGWCRPQTR